MLIKRGSKSKKIYIKRSFIFSKYNLLFQNNFKIDIRLTYLIKFTLYTDKMILYLYTYRLQILFSFTISSFLTRLI